MTSESPIRSEKACAKINLTLEVVGRRDDGYHEIASVVQAIDLRDTLSFGLSQDLYLYCDVPELVSPHNLVVRAARALQAVSGSDRGISISLDKAIPLASGLGGGSSDAAATLRALDEIWGLGLGPERLKSIAAKLGSDVPFFLAGASTAAVGGRGERVALLPSLRETWVVLVRPPVDITNKTQEMYSRLTPSHFTGGEYTSRMAEAIRKGEEIDPGLCYNVFDDVVFSSFPEIEECRRRFLAAGACHVHMAGSGPTLFALVDDQYEGEEICAGLKKERVQVCSVPTL
ncbi:MAG: 4-(cytidine 5'-diphospho)-2-C-methyl-D-erythritol kinase [Chloroflexi bacterium]|nr:4-(cytidine 5'-diphospho)-2-C-methyl-D-erythritol kinase [Chloroflexota bacterium]